MSSSTTARPFARALHGKKLAIRDASSCFAEYGDGVLPCARTSPQDEVWDFPVPHRYRTLYLLFGAPLGAAIEVGAALSLIVLIFLVRGRRPSFVFTIAGAVCMLIAHVIWWIWVNPANAALAHMAIQAPARDWMKWRNQWEYTHLTRFALQFFGFTLLLLSVLVETPGWGRLSQQW
jgi:ribose/xylose/arabinose/galactoside ABC-type transport system permease subunit